MPDVPRSNPGVYLPPPFLFAAGFLVGLALERWVVSLRLGAGARPLLLATGAVLMALGLGVDIWAAVTFRRARTTLLTFKPASRIVTSGPFRFSRNPMYVGLTLAYIGLSLLMNLVWPLLILPFVLVTLFVVVVRREELYLGDAFGEEYAEYRRRVRRWL